VLKETLLQAKELYMRRSSDLRYFEEQMVKILAKGDRQVLKGYNFEVYK
jgi:Fe-S cluster biosynthesis and repair protein YggX